ncbi:hypothetical protein D3C81_2035240 [compost metagenome]
MLHRVGPLPLFSCWMILSSVRAALYCGCCWLIRWMAFSPFSAWRRQPIIAYHSGSGTAGWFCICHISEAHALTTALALGSA